MAVGRLSKLSVFLSHLLLVLAIHHINLGYETSYSITDIKLGQIFARPPILIRKSQSSCFATNRPLVRWNKHGGTVIALPSDDRLYDINILILICGDVHPLPGPDSLSSRKGNNSNKLLDLPKAGVNIVSWNICHISNKLDELTHLLLHGNIDILGLQETFLNSNTLDSVSILPALSKIVERHVFLSLSSWFNKYNLLFSSQSSYRKHHSCITAMVNLVDQLIANMDDKLISSLLMIDLSKAFDTINHELLITKLSIYGVSPSSLKWFKAYLTSRRQYVRIDNVDSNSQIIRHGVPQGSILGPLLFIIFMNDINLVPISDCELHLYADDTTMLTCSPTMDQLMTTTNQALTTIVDWFLKNKLIVNLKKTECMTVMTKAKERFTSENNSTLSIDGNQIKQVFHHKLLGLVIDSHLTWNDHVDYIVSKAASRLFLLKKIKPFLSLKERKLFYSSMIMPVLEYGSVIWGDFYVGITERLLKQQKRAARIILDVKKPTDTPSADLFGKLNWLSFDKRIILQRGTLVYKCLNNLAPDYLCNIFTKLKDTRSRITRAFTNGKLALQRKFRLAVGQKSFLYRGTHLWNSLPLEITKSNDLNNFRTKLFRFLM